MAGHFLARSGLATLARRLLTRRGRFVLELHGVPRNRAHGLPRPLQPCLCRDDLRAILDWVTARFRMLTAQELLAAETPGLLLTFDDGFANQAVEALPLLERYRVPAVFFVTTCHVAEPREWLPYIRQGLAERGAGSVGDETLHEQFDGMSVEQLKACGENPYVTIGSHTASHPFLTRCDDRRLDRELETSKAFLEQHTGRNVDLLAYPSGDYDARVARAAREAGYKAAFAEDSRGLGLGTFEIPRIGLYRADDAYLGAKLSGLYRRPLPTRRRPGR